MKVAIIGSVGVPGQYGGFETLADNLVQQHEAQSIEAELTVYCSAKAFSERPAHYRKAALRYIGFNANGAQSIVYDIVSLLDAIRRDHDVVLLLGVSGALALPLLRLFSRARIVVNIDGLEWKRAKWGGLARLFLWLSEYAAVRFSHAIIADNQAIADHVRESYGSDSHVITYGGDHALAHAMKGGAPASLPDSYALALCRIEPENNAHTVLEAWAQLDTPLVFVGNWANSPYGRDLKARYARCANLYLLDPVYEPERLHALRARASVYVHGHSAGGTNPSLVEMMHFGIPVLAHGCVFNRHSTEGRARYFETSADLVREAQALTPEQSASVGADMLEIARRRYTWDQVGKAYFALLDG